jgi:acetyl-CoA synthetase
MAIHISNGLVHPNKGVFKPPTKFAQNARVNSLEQYTNLYRQSIDNPGAFWRDTATDLGIDVSTVSDKDFVSWNFDFRKGPIYTKWMEGAKVNMCYSALDLNIAKGYGDRVAYYW